MAISKNPLTVVPEGPEVNELQLGVTNTQPVKRMGRTSYSPKVVFSKARYSLMLVFVTSIFLVSCHDQDHDHNESKPWQTQVDQLKTAVVPYSNFQKGKDAGYDTEVTGYRTQMGFHYLKGSILDATFDVENPELLLYIPDGQGGLKFVAVEYAMPIADLNNPPPVPEGFAGSEDVWEINTEFKLWTLHVWVGMENPHGLFSPHNPNIP